jgi:5,10-methylenetetrahydromethanopterin reductase
MQISCGFPAGVQHLDHIVLAEELGYERAWVYDSPALYGDVWMVLALAADRTSRIGLGPAVLVPSLRHVVTTAAAVATLETLAPGRAIVAIGTGFTGRMVLGKKALSWQTTAWYIGTLQALLRGEVVEVDGAACQMIHPAAYAPARPIRTPIIVAANGPKGLEAAAELKADGVMTIGGPASGFDHVAFLAWGSVLDDDEDPGSDRVRAAAGPGASVVYHALWESGSVDVLPGGSEWRAAIEMFPERERHLRVHEGHLVELPERDVPVATADNITAFTWTGTAKELRARLDGLEGAGLTEVLFAPTGPDIPRELRAFAAMAGL